MRNSSASKKRGEYQKYMESRVLISSNSLNPLSKNISSKLDLIKQQLSRQFHEKFQTERRPRTNTIKKSTSGSKIKHLSKSKRDNQDFIKSKITGKKLNFDESSDLNSYANQRTQQNIDTGYRQKYYELQDKLMLQKQKYLQFASKQNNFKQIILNFIEQPTNKSSQSLRDIFPQRYHKNFDRIISLSQDVRFAENTLNQIMTQLDVQDIETLLTQVQSISKCQINRKTIDDYSFKILQLQTKNNKLQKQTEQRIRQIQIKHEQQMNQIVSNKQQEIKQNKSIIQNMKSNMNKFMQRLDLLLTQITSIAFNAQPIIQESYSLQNNNQQLNQITSRSMKRNRTNSQTKTQKQSGLQSMENILEKIRQKFKIMQNRVYSIQCQAEQNIQSFLSSKNDIIRLQKVLQQIRNETQIQKQKLVNSYERLIQQKQTQLQKSKMETENIDTLYIKVKDQLSELIQQNILLQEKLQHIRKQFDEKQSEYENVLRNYWNALILIKQQLIDLSILKQQQINRKCEVFSKKNTSNNYKHNNTIVHNFISLISTNLHNHHQDYQSTIITLKQMNQWYKKQLSIKQQLLQQFDFNLKKLVTDADNFYEKQRRLMFQRDQYKFLLQNLREQVIILRRQHTQALQKAIKQKDKQYLNSNASILSVNQKQQKQIYDKTSQISELKLRLEQISGQYAFYHKKCTQQEQKILQLNRKCEKSAQQAEKHKKCLQQIETSFKEVESMSEINTEKMENLQKQNTIIKRQISELKEYNQKLERICSQKNQQLSSVTFSLEQKTKKYEIMQKQKQDIEDTLSSLKIMKIQQNQQIRQINKQIIKLKCANAQLIKQNTKLSTQLAISTHKIINRGSQRNSSNACRQHLSHLKTQIRKISHQSKLMKQQIKEVLVNQKKRASQMIQTLCEDNLLTNKQQTKSHNKNSRIIEQLKNMKQMLNVIKLQNKTIKVEAQKMLPIFRTIPQENIDKYLKEESKYFNRHKNSDIDKQKLYQKVFKFKLMIQSLGNQLQSVKYETKQLCKLTQKSIQKIQKKIQAQNNIEQPILDTYFSFKAVEITDNNVKQNNIIGKQINNDECQQMQSNNEQRSLQQQPQQYYSPQFKRFRRDSAKMAEQHMQVQIQASSQKQQNKQKPILSTQTQRVNHILKALKNNTYPQIQPQYFQQIKPSYQQVANKIKSKHPLSLDISGISFQHANQQLGSPLSVNFSKDFILDHKRMHSEPNQQIGRSSNRSQKNISEVNIKQQNEILRKQIFQLEQYCKTLQQKQDNLLIQINELEKKNTYLENQTSQKTIQKLFLRFVDALVIQKIQEMETNCRTLMKIMGVPEQEIAKVTDYFSKKKKKKPTGLAGLFAK